MCRFSLIERIFLSKGNQPWKITSLKEKLSIVWSFKSNLWLICLGDVSSIFCSIRQKTWIRFEVGVQFSWNPILWDYNDGLLVSIPTRKRQRQPKFGLDVTGYHGSFGMWIFWLILHGILVFLFNLIKPQLRVTLAIFQDYWLMLICQHFCNNSWSLIVMVDFWILMLHMKICPYFVPFATPLVIYPITVDGKRKERG